MSVIRTAWRLAAGSAAILLALATPASAQTEAKPQYGGTLEIGNARGGGGRISVRLPLRSADNAARQPDAGDRT